MILRIEPTSPVPVYAQIVEQVKRAIATGILGNGDSLPSRREVAVNLEINPLTVLKAYKQLESEGLIRIKQGLGCFVATEPEQAVESYRTQTLEHAVDNLINDSREFGVPLERLEHMILDRIRRSKAQHDGGKQE